MYEVEQEIIDRLRDQCGSLFLTIASTMAVHESENERDLCPAVFVAVGSDDSYSATARHTYVDQTWIVTVALASNPDSGRNQTLHSVDGGRKLAVINALTFGWMPKDAQYPISYDGTSSVYSEFGYTEITMTFRTKTKCPT